MQQNKLKIRTARIDAGLSQSKLARKLGVEPSWVSALERGVHNPTLRTLERVAIALNCRVAELFEDDRAVVL